MTQPIDSQRENGWMPIESAPKDGSEIILAAPKTRGGSYWVHVGWWVEGDSHPWRFIDDFSMEPTGCCDREDGERVCVNGFTEDAPTHWMPLPTPPEA